ncbi:prohibitin family protein [Tistrella bauzanensis]
MTVADMAGSDEPGFFGRIGAWFWRHIWSITITTLVLLAAIILLWPMVFITVPAGHAGVVWYRFGGTNVDETRGEGLQFIWPWDRLEIYDVRFQTVTQTYDAITADGLTVGTTISFRFRLDEKYVGILHKNVGPDYLYKIIIPEVGSVTRARISQYTAEDFYSNLRTIVQTEIYEGVKTNFLRGSSYSAEGVDLIELEDVLIKAIHLPDRVAQAIERKVEQYQRQLEYDFRLASEQKEAERKRIEGEGIRMLFDQVGDAQIPDYLTWLGINATVQLAQSRNGKMVIIGNKDSGGMPLILGGIDSGGSQAVSTLERDRASNPLIAGDNNVGTVAIDPLGTGINGHDAADAAGVTTDTAGTAGPPSVVTVPVHAPMAGAWTRARAKRSSRARARGRGSQSPARHDADAISRRRPWLRAGGRLSADQKQRHDDPAGHGGRGHGRSARHQCCRRRHDAAGLCRTWPGAARLWPAGLWCGRHPAAAIGPDGPQHAARSADHDRSGGTLAGLVRGRRACRRQWPAGLRCLWRGSGNRTTDRRCRCRRQRRLISRGRRAGPPSGGPPPQPDHCPDRNVRPGIWRCRSERW